MILPYNDQHPRTGRDALIAPTAVVVGDVELNDGVSIRCGAALRGDMAPITEP
jgi:carbonic anhydrase/acetyltransferase-like protein (isoleucine patch superfamily)